VNAREGMSGAEGATIAVVLAATLGLSAAAWILAMRLMDGVVYLLYRPHGTIVAGAVARAAGS
jgi:hypothetical protein